MIKQLAHLCIFTNNINSVLKFYSDLGLSQKFTLKNDAGNDFGYYFDLGANTFLEIFDAPLAIQQWGGDIVTKYKDSHIRHFCLQAENLEKYVFLLKEKGFLVSDITKGMDNSLQAWIKDPDGNDIELMEYTKDSLQLT